LPSVRIRKPDAAVDPLQAERFPGSGASIPRVFQQPKGKIARHIRASEPIVVLGASEKRHAGHFSELGAELVLKD
jgi:hypothetical protein